MIKVIGFNFKKISINKISDNLKNLKINTKIDISNIEEIKSDFLKTDEQIIKVKFAYNIEYSPDIAKIELEGNILLTLNKDDASKILESWKSKKMSETFRISLFNLILKKSNVKALELEEEMNLPFHIPFPSLKVKKE
jgi:hypothetical protein